MTKTFRGFLVKASFFGALAPLLQATAQEEQSGSSQLEEVTVTARRTEENLQRVPISVTAYSDVKLQSLNVGGIGSLGRIVAGVTTIPIGDNVPRGANSKNTIYTRGVQGIPIYFNEIPTNSIGNGVYFDVNDVQVLKGPQGTLFGIATNGGAFLFQSKKPQNELEGHVMGGFGSRDSQDQEAVINIPIVDNRVLLRAGIQKTVRGGFIYDEGQARWLNGRNYSNGRIQLTLRNEAVENNTLVNYYASDTTGSTSVWRVVDTSGRPGTLAAFYGSTPFKGRTFAQWWEAEQANGPYRVINVNDQIGGTFERTRVVNVQNTTVWDFAENFSLKNIFGYQRAQTYSQNGSGTTFFAGNRVVLANGSTPRNVAPPPEYLYVDELQLNGSLFDDQLTFVLGSYNSRGETRGHFPVVYSAGIFATPTATRPFRNENSSHAVYTQATMNLDMLLEGLSITGGYRRTWDKRKQGVEGINPNTLATLSRLDLSGEYETPAYTAQVQYQVTPDVMLFVNNSMSYSVSSFNALVGLPAELVNVKPEHLNNIDAGIKSTWDIGGVPLRVNINGYYGKYYDAQEQFTTTLVNQITGISQLYSPQLNVSRLKLWGLEYALSIIPFRGLEISTTGAIQRYKIQKMIDPGTGQNIGGTEVGQYASLPFTPRFTYTVDATYQLPFIKDDLGNVSFSVNYKHDDHTYNFSRVPLTVLDGSPAWGQLNASLRWHGFMGYDSVDVDLDVNNINNNTKTGGVIGIYTSLGMSGYFPAEPRSWFLRAKYGF